MSVLQRKELEDSPLADLHAIASELGIEGYRALRREDLIGSILDVQGGGAPVADAEADDVPVERPRARRARLRGRGRSRSGARGGGEIEDTPESEEPERELDDEPATKAEAEAEGADSVESDDDEERETVTGVLDVLPNGSGFLRVAGGPDVYVSPAQIRRCELRSGDEVAGPVRPARRNERHPSLVRVESVNGGPAEPPAERPSFDDLTAVHPHERLAAPAALSGVPFGKGSRVAIAGPSGAGATRLLREIVATLVAQPDRPSLTVVLAGARPEEVTDWSRESEAIVVGGSFDGSPDEQAQAAQLAVERAKRVVERGGDAVVAIDTLAALPADLARRLLGAGRRVEEGGSLTVIATVGEGADQLRVASTRVVLAGGTGDPTVIAERSGAQRADLLG
ncbi:MAG TPA: Rho termination factor N-terminal domain-containing protein [Thermoleophilaceae bacterium]|nr:Rho termination factor N-terminal domain-containing protein [Thermoleophilaceae bacterium]